MTREEALALIPDHMHRSIQQWIDEGQPHPNLLGGFLRALLSNDLMGAFAHADSANTDAMRGWVLFLYNHAPSTCFGSFDRLVAWYEKHAKNRSEVQP